MTHRLTRGKVLLQNSGNAGPYRGKAEAHDTVGETRDTAFLSGPLDGMYMQPSGGFPDHTVLVFN